MIPHHARRSIEGILETYGRDVKVLVDETVQDGSHYLLGRYGEPVEVRASTRFANWLRDIRDQSFVPELYSEEASTWA